MTKEESWIAAKRDFRLPCMSNPLWHRPLVEWMNGVIAQGAQEISVWLSETYAQCGCESCRTSDQYLLVADVTIEAQRRVGK